MHSRYDPWKADSLRQRLQDPREAADHIQKALGTPGLQEAVEDVLESNESLEDIPVDAGVLGRLNDLLGGAGLEIVVRPIGRSERAAHDPSALEALLKRYENG